MSAPVILIAWLSAVFGGGLPGHPKFAETF